MGASGTIRSALWRRWAVATTWALASCHSGSAGAGASMPDSLAAKVNALVAPYVSSGNFSGVVLIAHEGARLLDAGYGSADYDVGVPTRDDQRYFIGSITKTFTAAATLLLVERGEIDLDVPVASYIADFPHGDRITVRHLLGHHSGLPNLYFRPDYAELAMRHYARAADVVALVRGEDLVSVPGTSYAYNNLNYSGLAWLIEQVAAVPYAEFLRREVLEPLGLEETGVAGDPAEPVPDLAMGHDPVGVSGFQRERRTDRSVLVGAGNMYTTARDLWRWADVVTGRRLLAAISDSLVFEYIGRSEDFNGHPAFVASGWDGIGYSAYLVHLRDLRLTVVALSNLNISTVVEEIGRGVTAVALGLPPTTTALAPRPLPPESLAPLAGRYRFGDDFFVPHGTLEIVMRDGTLFDLSRTPAAALVPLADGGFLYRPMWATVRFVLDDDGRVTGLRYLNRFVATKERNGGLP